VILLSLAPLAIVGGGGRAARLVLLGARGRRGARRARAVVRCSPRSSPGSRRSAPAGFQSVFAPLVIVALAIPLCVVASLVLVAWLMTPAMVRLVELRRFPGLERRRGAACCRASPGRSAAPSSRSPALVVSIRSG
jgi:hypothetical protein